MMTELPLGLCTIKLIQGDITKETCDAIVNAANQSLLGGGGVDGAIHRAGGPAILDECRKLGGCKTGDAKVTTGGRLPAKYVIHTVGPVWRGGNANEAELLASCYRRSLEQARQKGCKSVAFPSISTGAYGYPIERAAQIALSTVRESLLSAQAPEVVQFVLFSERDLNVYSQALSELVQS